MSKVWVIARREFLVTVTRKGYLFAVVGMPLLFGAIFGISFLTTGSMEQSIKSNSEPIAVIDRSHTLDFGLAAGSEPLREYPPGPAELLQQATGGKKLPRIVEYTDMTPAIRELKEGKLSAV